MSNEGDFIVVGDLHLRPDKPLCRIDDFRTTQLARLKTVSDLQEEYDCPVLCAGDVFNRWKYDPAFLIEMINALPCEFFCCYGNHDLPGHDIENWERCNLGLLDTIEMIGDPVKAKQRLEFIHYGRPFPSKSHIPVIMAHLFVDASPNDFVTTYDPKRLMKANPRVKLFVTGDNHKSFHVETKKQLLINAGNFTIQSTSELHNPKIYIVKGYRLFDTIEFDDLPNVSTEHIDIAEHNEERMQEFVDNLEDVERVSLDFEANVEEHMRNEEIHKQTTIYLREALDAGKAT